MSVVFIYIMCVMLQYTLKNITIYKHLFEQHVDMIRMYITSMKVMNNKIKMIIRAMTFSLPNNKVHLWRVKFTSWRIRTIISGRWHQGVRAQICLKGYSSISHPSHFYFESQVVTLMFLAYSSFIVVLGVRKFPWSHQNIRITICHVDMIL